MHSNLYLLIPYPFHAPLTSLSPLATISLFSIYVSLCLLCYIHLFYFMDSTYQCQHMVFVFVCLTYFTNIKSSICAVTSGKISFLLCMYTRNIIQSQQRMIFCVYLCVCIHITCNMNIYVYIYSHTHTIYSLFIHRLMDTQVASTSSLL